MLAKGNWLLARFRQIIGKTYGVSIRLARHMYLSTCLPTLTYGCAAWYTDSGKHSLSKTNKVKLERLQNKFLRAIFGAPTNAPAEMLRKELCIVRICGRMKQMKQFAALKEEGTEVRHMMDAALDAIEKTRDPKRRPPEPRVDDDMEECASILREGGSSAQKRVRTLQLSTQAAMKIWNDYRDNEPESRHRERPALSDGWGMHNVKRYDGLSRQEAIAVFLLRSGFAGLRNHKFGKARTMGFCM